MRSPGLAQAEEINTVNLFQLFPFGRDNNSRN